MQFSTQFGGYNTSQVDAAIQNLQQANSQLEAANKQLSEQARQLAAQQGQAGAYLQAGSAAAQLIEDAQNQAQQIADTARAEASKIIADAKQDAEEVTLRTLNAKKQLASLREALTRIVSQLPSMDGGRDDTIVFAQQQPVLKEKQ